MIVTASTTSRLCISTHARGGKKSSSNQEKDKERTRSRTFKITNDVGHAGLVAEGSSKVHGLLGVILTGTTSNPVFSLYPSFQLEDRTYLGERFDLSTVAGRTLSWQKAKRTVSGSFVLSIAIEGALRKKGGPNGRLQRAKDELSGLHEKKVISSVPL